MSRIVAGCLLFVATVLSLQAGEIPMARSAEPRTGSPGTIIVVNGAFLDKGRVEDVYLTDHRFDLKVKVLEQDGEHLKIRIPPFAKPGRHQLLFLTHSQEKSVYLEQPVYVLVEEAAEAAAAPEPASAAPVALAGAAPPPVPEHAATVTDESHHITPASARTDAATPPDVVPAASITTKVEVVKRTAPQYPSMARHMRIAGAVALEVTVGANGKVDKVKVVTGHPLLADSAVSSVKNWGYRPATSQGQPVSATIPIVLTYSLP